MAQETEGFKRRLFGGFDKRNVVEYIEKLAEERNALQDERITLREENQALRERLSALEEQASAPVPEPSPEPPAPPEREQSAPDPKRASDEDAREILTELKTRYDALCADIRINVSQTSSDVERLGKKITLLTEALEAAGRQLSELADRPCGTEQASENASGTDETGGPHE